MKMILIVISTIQLYHDITFGMGGTNFLRNENDLYDLKQMDICTSNILPGKDFLVYKVSDRVFQIGEINYDKFYISTIIKILDRGFKFIPCFHFNNFHIFKNLILSIEKEMFNFNRQIFF